MAAPLLTAGLKVLAKSQKSGRGPKLTRTPTLKSSSAKPSLGRTNTSAGSSLSRPKPSRTNTGFDRPSLQRQPTGGGGLSRPSEPRPGGLERRPTRFDSRPSEPRPGLDRRPTRHEGRSELRRQDSRYDGGGRSERPSHLRRQDSLYNGGRSERPSSYEPQPRLERRPTGMAPRPDTRMERPPMGSNRPPLQPRTQTSGGYNRPEPRLDTRRDNYPPMSTGGRPTPQRMPTGGPIRQDSRIPTHSQPSALNGGRPIPPPPPRHSTQAPGMNPYAPRPQTANPYAPRPQSGGPAVASSAADRYTPAHLKTQQQPMMQQAPRPQPGRQQSVAGQQGQGGFMNSAAKFGKAAIDKSWQINNAVNTGQSLYALGKGAVDSHKQRVATREETAKLSHELRGINAGRRHEGKDPLTVDDLRTIKATQAEWARQDRQQDYINSTAPQPAQQQPEPSFADQNYATDSSYESSRPSTASSNYTDGYGSQPEDFYRGFGPRA